MEYRTRVIAPNEEYARDFVKKNLSRIIIKEIKELKRYESMNMYEVLWQDR